MTLIRDSTINRMVTGVIWNVAASTVSQASVFLGSIIAARVLGVESFGELGIIQSTVGMLSGVAGAGLGVTATRYVSQFKGNNHSRIGKILGLCSAIAVITSIIFAGLLFFLAPFISDSLLKVSISHQLRIVSIYVLFFTLNGYQLGALTGFESFSKIAKANLLFGIMNLMTSVILIYALGLNGACYAMAFSSIVNWIYYNNLLKRQCKQYGISINYKKIFEEKDILLNFALPAAISGIIGALAVWGSNAILVRNTNVSQMALYSAANNFRLVILFIPSLISRVTSPILSNLLGNKLKKDYKRIFNINFIITVSIAVVLSIIISLMSPNLLSIYGNDFINGYKVMILLSIAAVFEVLAVSFYQVLFVNSKIWTQLVISSIWSFILLISCYLLSKNLGAVGLAISYATSWLFSSICYILVYRLYEKESRKNIEQ